MRVVSGGSFAGSVVRVARKAGRCQYWTGAAGRCTHQIAAGESYVEGEMDDWRAGGFARERYCLAHLVEWGAVVVVVDK